MVFRCNTLAQMVCTTWCIVSIFLFAIATVLTHQAFHVLIPPVVDMPQNLKDGLDNILHFAQLEESAVSLKNFSSQALGKCGMDPERSCRLYHNGLDYHDVTEEVEGVSKAFEDVLDDIENVTTDKYLGIEEFGNTAENLQEMKEELKKLEENTTLICSAIAESFCVIYETADKIVEDTNKVQYALSNITNNDAVKALDKRSNLIAQSLHIIPYFGWVGVFFYVCVFLCSPKAVTICRGGGCGTCFGYVCHTVFFLVYFLICVLISVIALTSSAMAKTYAIEKPFVGEPTLAELVDHIEAKFPDFYELVLKDFILGLERVRSAFLVNTFAALCLWLHTIFACCCGIYQDPNQQPQSI